MTENQVRGLHAQGSREPQKTLHKGSTYLAYGLKGPKEALVSTPPHPRGVCVLVSRTCDYATFQGPSDYKVKDGYGEIILDFFNLNFIFQ